ncbi:MAG TPA: tetratricopeptide repeat protein [Candidatus Aminicenantes bacterium]|nr:tetratricopeptide repeat protein [Candidatus Aminicenantes bacterium]
MKRSPWPAVSALALSFAAVACGGGAPASDLNVLVVTIDTLRPDRLSCYSEEYLRTPRIDRLAAKGALFERAFAHNPETLPSHANIFLGLTALAHGVSENSRSVVAPEFTTLAELFKARGYATGAFVSAFPVDSRFGLDQGFEVYDDRYPAKPPPGELVPERRARETVSLALAWLRGRTGPWFCWIHLWDPHDPYLPPEPYLSEYGGDLYSGEVAYTDAQLGPLFDHLEAGRRLDETIVVLTGDHGESLGQHGEERHGYFAYNATTWVPLIIDGPGIKASRVKDPVSHVDIFPTVCDLAGLEKPASLHGASLLPLLRGQGRPAGPIYFESLESHLNRGWAPLRGLIENGLKFIDSPIPELYDLERDFNETTNLAGSAELGAFRKRLREVMEAGASPLAAAAGRSTPDTGTLERLRSLGYTAARTAQLKSSYGPEDDLKTLLPLVQRLDRAAGRRKEGRLAESVKLLDDLIEEREDFNEAYEKLYEIYRSQGLVDDALEVYERGLAANTRNFVFLSGYGTALVMNGRPERGIEILESSLALFDQDPRVWNSLGVAYGNLGDAGKAREHFGRALALTPEDPVLNENVGLFYVTLALRTKDPDPAREAVPLFEQAIASDPSMASAYNGLAGALRVLGRTDEAIAKWEKAADLDPSFALPLYNLINVFLEKGDQAKVLQYCDRYLAARGRNITQDERREIEAILRSFK